MSKNLILVTNDYWAKEYYKESILPNNLKKLTLITEKKNKNLLELVKNNNLNHNVLYTKKLSLNWLKKNVNLKNSFLISAGSPWLIDQKVINQFKNKIFNVHQSALPAMRGAVNSFIRLYNIRAIQTSIHLLEKKIDEGDIVFTRDVYIKRTINTPLEINEYLQKQNRLMLKDFINETLIRKKRIIKTKQNNFFSSYNPRLNSDINGWINWNLEAHMLDSQINAFDDPYPGARTYIHGKKVILKDVDFSYSDQARHSFEYGMILRRFLGKLVVSVNKGSIYIGKVFLGKKNIVNKLKPGEIFYTPEKKINLIKRKNLFINKKKIYTKKRKLKKF